MMPNINNRWHYHKEIELICFHKGRGTQFVGDHVKRFEAGDIVLIGSNLPHYWKYDELCCDETSNQNDKPFSTVIHFYDNFLGEKFQTLPEFSGVNKLIQKAKLGIYIDGHAAQLIMKKIEQIYDLHGPYKILALLESLVDISNINDPVTLASMGFKYDYRESDNERLNVIYDFVLSNFKSKIQLEEVAALAGLVTHSFCRYFKARTGKTFTKFLIEIRIGYACKLIVDDKLDIKQICYESGFNNFSCFHKNFKSVTGVTPKLYRDVRFKNSPSIMLNNISA